MRRAAIAGVCLALASCAPDFVPASKMLADTPAEKRREREPVLERRRSFFDNDETRLRREWHVLIEPGNRSIAQGKDTSWYADGKLEYERDFDHGEPTGVWRAWHKNGNPRSEATFGTSERAPMRWWHENGQLSAEGAARNGHKDGPWTTWYPDGTKSSEGAYLDGLREGKWTFWNEDGSLKERGEFRGGERVGAWEHH